MEPLILNPGARQKLIHQHTTRSTTLLPINNPPTPIGTEGWVGPQSQSGGVGKNISFPCQAL